MKGQIYNISKNEKDVLNSEKIKLILLTENDKTVIDGGKIMTSSITTKSITANAIIGKHIQADEINTDHLKTGIITADKIQSHIITAEHIAAETITADRIKADTITAREIKADSITSREIKADTITSREIKADSITSREIKASTITSKEIMANSIEADRLKANTITSREILANSITSDRIKTGEVILPNEKYGGVYINSTGLNMMNSANHIALSAEKGLKIHNNLRGKTVFWANPTTGEIEMDVSKLTINSSNVYTEDNFNVSNKNLIYKSNSLLISKNGEYAFTGYRTSENPDSGNFILENDTQYTLTSFAKASPFGITQFFIQNTPEYNFSKSIKFENKENFETKYITFRTPKTGNYKYSVGGYDMERKGGSEVSWTTLTKGNIPQIEWTPSYEELNFELGNINLWEDFDSISGYSRTTDGVLIPGTNIHRTMQKLINIESYSQLLVQIWNPNKVLNNTNAARFAFFDSENKWIQNEGYVQLNGNSIHQFKIKIPEKAVKVRLGFIQGVNSNPEIIDKSIKFKVETGTIYTEWSPSPYDIYNKEEINSRFILENQKIELGINTKIDNIQVGGVNLQEKTSNSIKYSSFKGWNAYLEPVSGPYKKGDILTLSGYLISGINDVGLRMISTAETGNIIEYGQTNMIPPNSEGNVTSTVIVPVDTKNIRIVLRHNSGETPESKTGYRSIQLERGNKQTDWSPSLKDSYNKEETDAKIKITKDEIDIGVNNKIENSNLGGTNLIDGTKDLITNNQASKILSEKFKGNVIIEGDWTKVGGNTYVDAYSTKMNINATDKTYVLSFYAKANIADKDFRTYFYSPNRVIYSENSDSKINDSSPDGNSYFKTSTTWEKYWVRYKINPIEEKLNVIVGRYFDKELKLQISSPMLVASEFPIEWSPSKNDSYTKEETDSKIKITKDKIDIGVNEKIDNIIIGGNNLLPDSESPKLIPYSLTKISYKEDVEVPEWKAKNAVEHTVTGNDKIVIGILKPHNSNLKDNTWYTHSIYIKNLGPGDLKISANAGEAPIIKNGESKRLIITRYHGTNLSAMQFMFESMKTSDNIKFIIWHAQIEEGNKQTDWSPSPKDSYTKEETDARIKITKDNIDIGVNSKIQNLEIPRDNLLLGTSDFSEKDIKWNNLSVWNIDGKYNGMVIRKKEGLWNGLNQETYVNEGEEYTYSAYYKHSGKEESRIYIHSNSPSSAVVDKNFSILSNSKEWSRVYHSFKVIKSGIIACRIENTLPTGFVYVAGYKLSKGNSSKDWSPSPKDSYTKEETDARIKITKDNIDIGVKEEIKYSGIGSENLIYNSSMNNVAPYFLINGVKHYHFYKCTPSYIQDGFTQTKNNGETAGHVLDIGTSALDKAKVGLDKYNFKQLKAGDFVTFSGELENIDTDFVKLEMFYSLSTTNWNPPISSPVLLKGEKGILSVMMEIPKDAVGILLRVYCGNVPGGRANMKNLMFTKGKVTVDWKAHPNDLISDVYNSNLLENSDFVDSRAKDVVAKNPDNYPFKWEGYNAGVSNATTVYHAHVNDSKFGYNVVLYDESDGTRNWKGIQQIIAVEDVKILQNGGNLWFSLDMFKDGSELGSSKVNGGMYYYNKAGNRQFHEGQYTMYSKIVGEWERNFCSVPFNVNNADLTKDFLFYIYGYNYSDNSKLYIKNAKLEIGKFVTPYELSNKDVVKTSEMREAQFLLEPDRMSQLVTSSEHFVGWSDDAIGGKANQEDLDDANDEVVKQRERVDVTVERLSLLEIKTDGMQFSFKEETTKTDAHGTTIADVIKSFDFGANFLTIRVSNSPFTVNITNEKLSFKNGAQEIAYINGELLYIKRAQILNSIIIGNHLIESDKSTGQTIFKYIV